MMQVKVAISACLLGQPVRYDGKSKLHTLIEQYILPYIEAVPICPEVGAGMGVPREKIQLVKIAQQIRVRNVLRPEVDVTVSLLEYAQTILQTHPDLSAMIIKSKSPSCGLTSTPVFENDKIIKYAAGQFSYAIRDKCPTLLMLEETALDSKKSCQIFLAKLGLSAF